MKPTIAILIMSLLGFAAADDKSKTVPPKTVPPKTAPPKTAILKTAPTNAALREELLRRTDVDQKARYALIAFTKKHGATGVDSAADLSEENRAEFEKIAARMNQVDADNTKWLKEIIKKSGWPTFASVGKDGANSAWVLVQHADAELKFQRKCLDLMARLPKQEVSQSNVAYLTDRVLLAEGKKQLYGTQFQLVDGKLIARPIEDQANVDIRRKRVGLPPLEDYRKMVEKMYGGGKAK